MKNITCVPDASLMNSMRSVGYELKTALADVIDNSISAGARNISVRYHDEGQQPFIAVIDDGCGMDYRTAVDAMRLGSDVHAIRSQQDLGRFGLGLKTASLSQARSLLICTRQNGKQTTLRWDLDYIQKTGDWSLEELDKEEAERSLPPSVRREFFHSADNGTVVLWRKLDKLEALAGKDIRDFDRQMDEVEDYLALVFHRFLHPYPMDVDITQIHIAINGTEVPEIDPFLTQSLKTHTDPPQRLANSAVMLQAITLPQMNQLNNHERALLQLDGKTRHSLLNTQGFYVYRSHRLINWGSWFRMARKEKRLQRYRVRVDIPNSMDSLWALDVKKSRAVPPVGVRRALRGFMQQFTSDPSILMRRRMVRKKPNREITRLWKVMEDEEGRYGFVLDGDSPVIKDFVSSLDSKQRASFTALSRLLSTTVPLGELIDEMGHGLEESSRDDFMVRVRTIYPSLPGRTGSSWGQDLIRLMLSPRR